MRTLTKRFIFSILSLIICYGCVVDGAVSAGELDIKKKGDSILTETRVRELSAQETSTGFDKNMDPGILTDRQLAFLPTYLLAQKIRLGEVSSTRITNVYLSRIAKYNPQINAIVTLDDDGARKRARQADEALANGIIWGPLHGVPITIKDNYSVKGMRSTAGYLPLKDNIPENDATLVKRLRDAGAIIMGKTNMPQLGMDSQTFNPIFGVTNNPWDLTRTPGGSSGGCAAAVAAGLTSFSIGNDIGGSIRSPAHFTGVFGIKPTEGYVPETGMVDEVDSHRTVRHLLSHGPIARSVEDLSLVLDIISGADGIDMEVPRGFTEPETHKRSSQLRIAWTDQLDNLFVSTSTQKAIQMFVSRLAKAGVSVHKQSPPDIDFTKTVTVFANLFYAEALSDLSWFEREAMCLTGGVCPTTDMKTYFRTLSRRDEVAIKMEAFLKKWDAWIVPAGSGTAYKHRSPDEFYGPFPVYKTPLLVDGKVDRSAEYLSVFNLTGHPSVVIPIGFSIEGLPIGVQLVGRKWYDVELLDIAAQIAAIGAEYRHPPGFE